MNDKIPKTAELFEIASFLLKDNKTGSNPDMSALAALWSCVFLRAVPIAQNGKTRCIAQEKLL